MLPAFPLRMPAFSWILMIKNSSDNHRFDSKGFSPTACWILYASIGFSWSANAVLKPETALNQCCIYSEWNYFPSSGALRRRRRFKPFKQRQNILPGNLTEVALVKLFFQFCDISDTFYFFIYQICRAAQLLKGASFSPPTAPMISYPYPPTSQQGKELKGTSTWLLLPNI